MIRCLLFILVVCSCDLLCGCSGSRLFAKKITTKASYETCAAISSEDMKLVNKLNKQAVAEMNSPSPSCQKVETLLKKALSIDPNCGKAHYNLGVLYARQNNYYLAALEFEKAKNLNYDPDMNLQCILDYLRDYNPTNSGAVQWVYTDSSISQQTNSDDAPPNNGLNSTPSTPYPPLPHLDPQPSSTPPSSSRTNREFLQNTNPPAQNNLQPPQYNPR